MITRMEIHYRSQLPCSKKPEHFTTGGYCISIDGRRFHFDFEDMEATAEIKDGYLHIHSLQRNIDDSLLDGYTYEELDAALKRVSMDDFTEIYCECYGDEDDTVSIALEPVSITFYDFAPPLNGSPIIVCAKDISGNDGDDNNAKKGSQTHAIKSFTGEHSFLSNFYPCEVSHEGLTYPCAETAFQATKYSDVQDRIRFQQLHPAEAKKAGRQVNLRSDWESVKVSVMIEVVKSKFNCNTDLTEKLLQTGDTELTEGNTWHDNFWGDCACIRCENILGQNMLGKILMERRRLIREEQN